MITSDSLIKTGELYNDYLVNLSQRLGKKLLNIDHLTETINIEEYLSVNKTLAEEYISSIYC